MYKLFDKLSSLIIMIALTTIIFNNLYFYNTRDYEIAVENQVNAQKTLRNFIENYGIPIIFDAFNRGVIKNLLDNFVLENDLFDSTYIQISSINSSFSSKELNLRNKGIAKLTLLKGDLLLVIEVWVGEQ